MSMNLFSTFPGFVDEELNRRQNRNELQNPKSPWMRMTSGFKPEGGDRRILMGGDLSLNERIKFGFEGLYDESSSTGEKYRPEPAITSISVDEKLESFECTVEWTAHSIEQLEELFPYFMNLGTTVLVDWGWSNVPPGGVIDVSSDGEFQKPFQNLTAGDSSSVTSSNSNVSPSRTSRFDHPKYEKLKQGRGRYSFVAGHVGNFSFSPEGNSQYSCTTEVTSISKSLAKLSNQSQEFRRNKNKQPSDNVKKKKPLYEWINQSLENHLSKYSEERPKEVVKIDAGEKLNQREDATAGHTYYMSWREIEHIVNTKIGLESKNGVQNIKLNSAGSVISSYTEGGGSPPLQLRSMDPLVCVVDVGGQSTKFRNLSSTSLSYSSSAYADGISDWLDDFSADPKHQGFLYNLYVEYQLFVEAFEKNNTIFKALNYILRRCEQACFGIWNFDYVIDSNIIKVIDKNMIAENSANDILNTKGSEHTFRPNTRRTVLRDFNFDTDLNDAIKGQVVFQNRADLNTSGEEGPAINFRDDAGAKFFEKEFPGKDVVLEGGKKLSHSEIETSSDQKQANDPSRFSYESPLDRSVAKDEGLYGILPSALQPDIDTEKVRKEAATTIESHGEVNKYLFYVGDSGASTAQAFSQRLQASTDKLSSINSNNAININAQLTLAGIGGLSAHQTLSIKNIPNIFENAGVFVIDSVSHSVSADDWTTELKTKFLVKNMLEEEQ